jgi:hypothetical protein
LTPRSRFGWSLSWVNGTYATRVAGRAVGCEIAVSRPRELRRSCVAMRTRARRCAAAARRSSRLRN